MWQSCASRTKNWASMFSQLGTLVTVSMPAHVTVVEQTTGDQPATPGGSSEDLATNDAASVSNAAAAAAPPPPVSVGVFLQQMITTILTKIKEVDQK